MDTTLVLGIIGAVISTIGFIATSLAGMYYLGYSRGKSDWRVDDYFAPRPIATSVDKEIADDYIKLRQKMRAMSYELRERGVEIP
jgi:hypothetical protein